MGEVVGTGYRDGDRVKRLRERQTLLEQQSPNWGLDSTVLTEAIELWIDVLQVGSRFERDNNASPGEQADAEEMAFVSRMDQSKVSAAVQGLAEVSPHEQAAAAEACGVALSTLRNELLGLSAASRGASGDTLPRLFADNSTPQELDAPAHIAVWLSRAKLLLELLRASRVMAETRKEVEALKSSVTESATEATAASTELETIREQLNEARAERARGKLADQFKSLHKREASSSRWFRIAAFGLLALASYAVLKFAGSASLDWEAAATHVAIAGLFGGASAYAARLAAAHRGTADWAKAIEVQLETFEDFLGAIDNEATRHRVYEEFGRRVLGSPPIAGEDPGTMPTAQLIELLIAASRRP
jgi:ABC-type multidrug transport system fused ATPase/permease subunit